MNVGRDFIPILAEGHVPSLTAGVIDLAPDFKVPASTLKNAVFIAPAAGTAFNFSVTIGGTYVVGDEIVVTVLSNDNSTQKWRKSYKYVVPAGGTANNSIAAAINQLIQADAIGDAPYTSSVAANVVTITHKEDDSKGLEGIGFTNSTAGTIAIGALTGTISEGNPQDLIDRGIDPNDINNASYDTVRIIYEAEAPVASIDSNGPRLREIFWYGDTGTGANLATLIN